MNGQRVTWNGKVFPIRLVGFDPDSALTPGTLGDDPLLMTDLYTLRSAVLFLRLSLSNLYTK